MRDQNYKKLDNLREGAGHQPTKDQEFCLDDDKLVQSLLIANNKIPFPKTEEWKNLGEVARKKAKEKENKPFPKYQIISFWAIAASLVILLGIAALNVSPPAGKNMIGQSEPLLLERATEQSDAQEEFVQIEALLLQTELDIIAVELAEVTIGDDDEPEVDILEVITDYDIDPAMLFENYMKAL